LAGKLGGQLVGQAAIQARCQVQRALADPILAEEGLDQFHGRPNQLDQEVVFADALGEGLVDDHAADVAVAGEKRLQILL
jgi:hypothetical protein